MRAVIDRIEGNLAVLEIDGKTEIIFPLKFLPSGSQPGNILNINISLNPNAEHRQKEKIKKLQEKLKNR